MITQQDLIDRFGEQELTELSDHVNQTDMDAVVVAKAISDAESEAMAYLTAAKIASVVQITPPLALQIKLCDIARYYLYENGVTDIVQERYDRAIAWLEMVMRNPQMLIADTKPNATAIGKISGAKTYGFAEIIKADDIDKLSRLS